jgi:hypothetical protein
MPRVILTVLIALLSGCGAALILPPYDESELQARCERQGGWWHAHERQRSFGEYQAPGMM